jgi:hypothetical protein
MSILSQLAKKFLRIPEIKIPYGEVMLLNQIKDTLHYLSTSDLDLLSVAIKAERATRGTNL